MLSRGSNVFLRSGLPRLELPLDAGHALADGVRGCTPDLSGLVVQRLFVRPEKLDRDQATVACSSRRRRRGRGAQADAAHRDHGQAAQFRIS